MGGRKDISGKHRCINRCCRPNPCLNEGVFQEICDTHGVRFSCGFPDKYTGQRCERTKPTSCEDIAKYGASKSGEYDIFDSKNYPFSVYCDLQSEPSFVWTLIQSFSLAKKGNFEDKPFGVNFEINNDKKKSGLERVPTIIITDAVSC